MRRFDGIFLFAPLCTCTSWPFSLPRRTSELSVSSFSSSSTSRRTSYPRWNNRSASLLPDPHVTVSISRARPPPLRPWLCALPPVPEWQGSNVAAELLLPPPGRALYPHGVKSSSAASAVQHRAVRVREEGGEAGESGATPASERGRAFPPLLAPPNPSR